MLKAIEKYDYGHESKASFNTYAYNWIRAEVYRFLKTHRGPVRVPEHAQRAGVLPAYVYLDGLEESARRQVDSQMTHDAGEPTEEHYSFLYDLIDEAFRGRKLSREYMFFAHKYGIDGYEKYTGVELARRAKVSAPTVRGFQRRAEARLKNHIIRQGITRDDFV